MAYEFKYFRAGRLSQIDLTCGADIAALAEADRKLWTAISMPVKGVRFDARTLELMDTDHDGRIRTPEVLAAIDFLKSKNVDFDELFVKSETDEQALASVLERQADLAKLPPSDADQAALAAWEAKGKTPEVAVLGDDTAAAEAALAAVEPIIDAFFTPPEDMPLVTEEPDKTLPLKDHLNPRHLEAILDFSAKCVVPVVGAQASLSRLDWKRVKGAFAPYRAWIAAKPVMNAGAKGELEEEERLYRYKLHLLEFLENYTNMKRLYSLDSQAVFQTGFLRIDAREMNLCFHVDSEAAHSALAEKSKCCVIYLKLTRPADKAERLICAVVTAGNVNTLYVGRNGVFYDRDGKDWEAVVTKVVEAQVSLMEAFWSPWRKLGEGVSGLVKKFLGDKQAAAQTAVAAGTQNTQAGGAAMASSVAAIGIGVGMMGAAMASILAAIKGMDAAQILLAICAVIAVVSLPSVILTWFKLRQRDIGAILNASGWAVNRPLHFSIKRAAAFTVCPPAPVWIKVLCALALWAVFAWIVTGCTCGNPVSEIAAVSPDGKNEIKLYANPLAYEVLRNGKTVVAKTEIGLKVDGEPLAAKDGKLPCGKTEVLSGTVDTPVYKKACVDLAGNKSMLCFGDWGLQAVARNDGVAYRFVLKREGAKVITCEKAGLVIPEGTARCWFNRTSHFGNEETVPEVADAKDLPSDDKMIYLPFAYAVNGTCVAVTESNVQAYPILNFTRGEDDTGVALKAVMAKYPKSLYRKGGWGNKPEDLCEKGGRWVCVKETEDYLAKAGGELPWRVFVLGDKPSDFMGADIVNALAKPQCANLDFSWIKPGKVAWDWWNAFDNLGDPQGCTTKTYERFIDFAAKNGVEYVIFDEGWSAKLNIWEFSPVVDVPHLIKYANAKGVGIILWMAWAQVYGDEARVAEHFAKLGAKGFKVDFMDRGDAQIADFLEKFASECAKNKMLVDYHGVYRPVGLSRTYPNVVNYEGIHGLEQMKWFPDTPATMMYNDVAACFLRMTAGPLDYTPGAMLNFPVSDDTYAKRTDKNRNPGSVGTRCHQMAMMAMYEAPLQMLADSPTHYEQNMESFSFMSKVPVVWQKTVGLGGCPESYAAIARQAKDGSWYVAVLNGFKAATAEIDLSFLGEGEWKSEFFADAADADKVPTNYVHGNDTVKAGAKLKLTLASGGGYVAHLVK